MSSEDDDIDSKSAVGREILIAAIFSVLAVLIFIIILRTYARYLSRSQERTRRDILNRVSTLAQIASVDLADSVDPPAETAGGLDPLVIASLPKFTYKAADALDQSEVIECSVCLSSIEEEAMVRLLPNCKHMFHVECIDVWLNSNKTCPVCRTVADPKVQPERNDIGITGVQRPTAPPIENSTIPHGAAELEKAGGSGSGSRLSSFRRMLSRGRSSRRIQSCEDHHEMGSEDLERQ